MKKGFKRFLSSALATVMAVAGMTIGMATTASAATTTWVPNDDGFDTCPAVFGLDADTSLHLDMANSRKATFTDAIFAGGVSAVAGKSGIDIRNQFLNGAADTIAYRSIALAPTESGTIDLYVVRQSSGSAGTLRIYAATKSAETGLYERGDLLQDSISVPGRDTTGIAPVSFQVESGNIYLVYANSSGIGLYGMSHTAGEVVNYTWNLDLTGLVNVDGNGLALANDTSTSVKNTLSYTGSGYVLKDEYTTISDTTIGVTVDSVNNTITVKPTDDWFDAVAPRTYVSVEPVVTGNQTVYNFVQADDSEKYLISATDDAKSNTTAYVDFAGTNGTDNDCYVTLDTTGAKLCDDSASAAVKLVIPYAASTGKVTVSGTVTPTNNIGGKWKLVDFGCVAVSTDADKMVTLTDNNSASVADNVGIAVKGQAVTYSVTLDLDARTASGTITNGATSKDFTNIPFIENTSLGSIAFITNNGNSITAGNDRGLLIPSVTITAETSVTPLITKTTDFATPAVLSIGDTHYVVSVISNADATNIANNTVAQSTATAVDVATSDTVYEGVQINDKVYTAVDFCDTAAANDYVFASIIENNNNTASETVVTDIQKLVTSVK